MKRIGVASALLVMLISGWYVFVYLYRWEWNRALVAGIIFLAAEIGLLGAALFSRLNKLGQQVDELGSSRGPVDERVLHQLRVNAPDPLKPFAWLDGTRSNVFVPVLLGAGAVLSGLAWLVDRVARLTATPAMEKTLARKLTSLHPTPGGLLGDAPIDPFRPR
jgi:hypothetical protein